MRQVERESDGERGARPAVERREVIGLGCSNETTSSDGVRGSERRSGKRNYRAGRGTRWEGGGP